MALGGGGGYTITRLVKAMLGIAMACIYDDLVTAVLEADGCVNDESLGATNAQVWVQEDNGLLLWSPRGCLPSCDRPLLHDPLGCSA